MKIEKLTDADIAGIANRVQLKTGYILDEEDIQETALYATRKAEQNGKGWSYLPILFENELLDLLMRRKINESGRLKSCAAFADIALA